QELLQLLAGLAGAEPNADRVGRVAFIEEIGALLARQIDRQAWRALAIFLVDAADPQIGRLADMGIGGDQAVLGHLVPPSERRGLFPRACSPPFCSVPPPFAIDLRRKRGGLIEGWKRRRFGPCALRMRHSLCASRGPDAAWSTSRRYRRSDRETAKNHPQRQAISSG